ncbi:substrate-binding domain-containing protein [Cupriavidus basilensis]
MQKAMVDFPADLDDAAQPPQTRIRFSGGHDPAMEVTWRTRWHEEPGGLQLDTVFCGSVEGLICLQERQSKWLASTIRRSRPAGSVAHVTLPQVAAPRPPSRLIRLAWREQGLIVTPGLAREIRDLRDLACTRARLRQPAAQLGHAHAVRPVAGHPRPLFRTRSSSYEIPEIQQRESG